MLFLAQERGDITEMSVGDFGVGPGMLSIASSLMGSDINVGFDVDQVRIRIQRSTRL